eukprot:9250880-Pyramimonas_sp.AAC.1
MTQEVRPDNSLRGPGPPSMRGRWISRLCALRTRLQAAHRSPLLAVKFARPSPSLSPPPSSPILSASAWFYIACLAPSSPALFRICDGMSHSGARFASAMADAHRKHVSAIIALAPTS